MNKRLWIPLVVGLLALLALGAVLLVVVSSSPATATLRLIGHPFPGNNHYAVTLTIPSGSAAPTEGVTISDSGSKSCTTSKLSPTSRRTFTGGCRIGNERTGTTVEATYNRNGSDPNYAEATSNTLKVPKAPPGVPTVVSVLPNSGPTSGGTDVSITGTAFVRGITVKISQGVGPDAPTIAATDVEVMSPTKISAVTRGGALPGTWNLFVTTAGGTSAVTPADDFTYAPVPAVTSVSPNAGPTSGGTAITVTGTGFVPGATVGISQGAVSIVATDVDVISSTKITAVTAGDDLPGTWNLFVTTAGGVSAVTPADAFTYAFAPTVSSVSPNFGPASRGGTHIIITGTEFTPGATVSITQGVGPGSPTIAATDVKVVSSKKIVAVTSGGALAGTWNLYVTTAGGTSAVSPADDFTYIPAPTIASVSPAKGTTSGGTGITITGTGFLSGATVRISQGKSPTIPASDVEVISPDKITAVTGGGAKAGTWRLFVTTAGGISAVSRADAFTYARVPTVSSVSPNSDPP